ncbi:uncharacterized protein LOC132938973 isoform X2 [Metopolophium dirhodum]|uniref:uncharacterized protein LOC132938457 isoform X2 n=1 Tax=Metopolophium dirhodum TaxID=44670 RepID=UPI0029901ABB|nr:uncharacterized protein LOC132938457 isoform X2 [Metopolophium dirhodum]XP_060861938.1 uncharacterized protein LOC132938973 isoform X2 [Metopolophium dirhodum]
MKTTVAVVAIALSLCGLFPFVTVALPVAGDGQNESVATNTELQTTTVLPVDTTTESVSQTAVEAVESTTENADQTTAAVPSDTTTDIVNETTTEPAETTTEPAETTTEDVVQTTTEPLELATSEATTAVNNTLPAEVVKDKLSEQIRKILKHYQHPDPVGFPGAPIPDPLSIPPMNKDFGVAFMTFKNMTVHGLSKFKVENVNADLKNMRVYVLLKIRRMYVLGNYTLRSWLSRPASGPFNVTLIEVEAAAEAALEPDADGNLQATETEMDMQFKDCELDFKNLGFAASMMQGIISSMGSVLFEGIKPFIISEVNTNLRADVNAQVKAITSKLPKMTVPVPDLAVAEGRKYVQRMGFDPYHVADRHIDEGPLNFTITELTVSGLSSFHRVGDIGLQIRGPVLQMAVHVITGAINGSLRWSYRLGLSKTFSRTGVSNFTVDHIQVRALVNQTLDIRNKPVLEKLDIEVGKIEVQMDRKEPLDYVIEIAVNSLPSLLRHIIVDALEEPIKAKAQTILDDVQVEKMVEDRLPELDRMVGD